MQSDPDWLLTIVDDAYPSTEPEHWVRSLAGAHDAEIVQPVSKVIDQHGVECLPLTVRVKLRVRPRFRGSLELSFERLAKSLSRGDRMYIPAMPWKAKAPHVIRLSSKRPHGTRPPLGA